MRVLVKAADRGTVLPTDSAGAMLAGQSPSGGGRRKDTFIATLAHELRQPLSTMSAAAGVVRLARDVNAAHRAAEVIERQVDLMTRLVDDLVDSARWALGKVSLHKDRLDLCEVIRQAAADVTGSVLKNGQELLLREDREPIWVNGDRQRLLQVVSNLLRNAVKFSPSGGRITIAARRRASTVALCVADTGRGIKAAELPHLFDLFSQTSPGDGTGLGIGLSVVREIVQLHGGSVEARSRGARKGSEFIVTLPLDQVLA
jgi:signal transduction histidine kinase